MTNETVVKGCIIVVGFIITARAVNSVITHIASETNRLKERDAETNRLIASINKRNTTPNMHFGDI